MKVLWVLYVLLGFGLAGGYAARELRASEPPSSAYQRIDPSLRYSTGSSGGSGSHFWFSGSHGGK